MVLHYVISWLRYGHVLISNILIFIFLLSLSAYGQQFPIQGTVRSAEHEEPLQGATIAIEGTSILTISDAKGHFELRSPHAEGVVHIKYIGYLPQRIPFSDAHLEVFLNQDDNRVEEVQVIGYGETTRRLNTGSVASISAKEIEKQPVTNVLSALSGRMPGVFVQTTNGLPGGNINIQIRGTGSIQAGTNPLYIIDGVPYDGEALGDGSLLASNNIAGSINPLNILNPTDIEHISVLKDADATAIYGSRGSNGVVLITTKKGKVGKTNINATINQGFSKVANHPQLLDLKQYLDLRREAFLNDDRTPSSDPASPDYAPDLTVWSQTEGVDWSEYVFGQTANLTSSQLTVSGGKSNTSFNISGNYRTEGTVMLGDNKYNRGGLRSTISHMSDNGRFRLNLSSIYNIDETSLSNPVNTSDRIFLLPPNYPLFEEDGSYNWYAGINSDAQQKARSNGRTDNFITNLFATYTLPVGVELKISGGYSRRSLNQRQTFPTISLHPSVVNYTVFGDNSSNSFIIEPQAEYQKEFNKSKLKLLIGGTFQSSLTERLAIKASNFSNEFLMENLGSAGTIDSRTNVSLQYKYISAFGRLTYLFQDKYVMNATARRDGSSRFGPDSRFGTFYSIGGAWIFSEENLLKDRFGILSFGKIRASYGITGNDQISDYQYLSTYRSSGSNVYKGLGILEPSRIFNSNFHWEVTKKFELATELGFVDDRLFLTINFYQNRSDNQLVSYPLPSSTGFSSYQANLPAVVQNTGWEFDLNAVILGTSNFRWQTTANLTLPRNKLVRFDDIENSSYANTLKVGYDITRVYGYHLIEVDPETGIAQYADENGEKTTSPYAFHTLGKRTPDYYGSIGNTFSYRNFQLDIFAQFSKQASFGNLSFAQFGFQPVNAYAILNDRWTNIGDIAALPKVSANHRHGTAQINQSNANYFDVGYLRLKNISLSYNLPTLLSKKLGAESVQLSVAAQNILTFWDSSIPVSDPESGGNSSLTTAIPPVKSIVFGVNLTL